MEDRISILFLCTGNSARSILAEVIANHRYGETIMACSAGSTPKSAPNPLALATLARHGLPTDEARSKSWNAYAQQPFDLVVTLCDSAAAEPCPAFPGAPVTTHWGFPDPPAAGDAESVFEMVFAALDEAIGAFARSDESNIQTRAEAVRATVAERFPGSQ